MKRTLFIVVAVVVGFAAAASAATLSIAADRVSGIYNPGETIVLTVTGDSEGRPAYGIIGTLLYSAALTDTVTSTQTRHTWNAGLSKATTGGLARGDGFAGVFNQGFGGTAVVLDATSIQIATATLTAQALGVVSVTWNTDVPSGTALDFFGLTNGPGTTFTIVPIPEPTTAALLGLGIIGLVLGGRRRS